MSDQEVAEETTPGAGEGSAPLPGSAAKIGQQKCTLVHAAKRGDVGVWTLGGAGGVGPAGPGSGSTVRCSYTRWFPRGVICRLP